MRVLVTRPEPDDLRTAEALIARGHEPVRARLTAIIPAHPPLVAGHFEAAVATSAHALEHLPDDWLKDIGPDLPLFVVGERTAAAARQKGFGTVMAGPGDAAGLVARLLSVLKPRSHLLYFAGEPRKPLLETALADANHAVETILVYRAVPVSAPPPELLAALDGRALAVLHFSRASAASFAALAQQAGKTAEAAQALHLCLSADVARGLDELAPPSVHIAPAPHEAALLDTLEAALAQNAPWPPFKGDGSVSPRYSTETSDADGSGMSDTTGKDDASGKRPSRRKPQTIDLAPSEHSENLSEAATAAEPVPEAVPEQAAPADSASFGEPLGSPDQPAAPQIGSAPSRAGGSTNLPGAIAGGLVAAVLFGLSSLFPALFGNRLPERVAALELRPAPLPAPPADLKPLSDRLALIEGQLPALTSDLQQTTTALQAAKAAAAEIPALRARLDQLASGTSANGTVDPETLASLAQRLTALETTSTANATSGLAALETRLKAAEDEITALRALAQTPQSAADPAVEAAARLAVFDALKRKFSSGQGFEAELAAITPFAANSPALAVLKNAEQGVPTLDALATGFLALTPTIDAAIQPQGADQSLLQRLAQSASGLVEVTPADGTASADPASLAGRVAAQIRAGALAEALAALSGLPEAGKAAAQPVMDSLSARQSLETALAELGRTVLGSKN